MRDLRLLTTPTVRQQKGDGSGGLDSQSVLWHLEQALLLLRVDVHQGYLSQPIWASFPGMTLRSDERCPLLEEEPTLS